jgi:hypothetical protein
MWCKVRCGPVSGPGHGVDRRSPDSTRCGPYVFRLQWRPSVGPWGVVRRPRPNPVQARPLWPGLRTGPRRGPQVSRLYTVWAVCFPVAVETFGRALGRGPETTPQPCTSGAPGSSWCPRSAWAPTPGRSASQTDQGKEVFDNQYAPSNQPDGDLPTVWRDRDWGTASVNPTRFLDLAKPP